MKVEVETKKDWEERTAFEKAEFYFRKISLFFKGIDMKIVKGNGKVILESFTVSGERSLKRDKLLEDI